jgi:hypothetical protein
MSAGAVDRATELLEMIEGKWMTQAIGVAAELGIADHLSAGTNRVGPLAAATRCDGDALERLLHALVSLGVCSRDDGAAYRLTSLGELLRDGRQGSLRHWAIWSARYHWSTWGKLAESVRSGESARVLAGGANGYEHLERDAAAAEVFNRGLGGLTRIVGSELARRYDFSAVHRVMDVGGGQGQLLSAVLERHPRLHGIVFDRPHAIDTALPIERCERVAGDFFESIPARADVYVMKSILHNWDDGACAAILAQCSRAMEPRARLLVVERVLPETFSGETSERPLARSDLNMLVGFSGRERTLADFTALLRSAGLSVHSCQPLALGFSLIEAR